MESCPQFDISTIEQRGRLSRMHDFSFIINWNKTIAHVLHCSSFLWNGSLSSRLPQMETRHARGWCFSFLYCSVWSLCILCLYLNGIHFCNQFMSFILQSHGIAQVWIFKMARRLKPFMPLPMVMVSNAGILGRNGCIPLGILFNNVTSVTARMPC